MWFIDHLNSLKKKAFPLACVFLLGQVCGVSRKWLCYNVFTKKSSFTSHISRKHKASSFDFIDDVYRDTRPEPQDVMTTDGSENTHETMPTASAPSDIPENGN